MGAALGEGGLAAAVAAVAGRHWGVGPALSWTPQRLLSCVQRSPETCSSWLSKPTDNIENTACLSELPQSVTHGLQLPLHRHRQFCKAACHLQCTWLPACIKPYILQNTKLLCTFASAFKRISCTTTTRLFMLHIKIRPACDTVRLTANLA